MEAVNNGVSVLDSRFVVQAVLFECFLFFALASELCLPSRNESFAGFFVFLVLVYDNDKLGKARLLQIFFTFCFPLLKQQKNFSSLVVLLPGNRFGEFLAEFFEGAEVKAVLVLSLIHI